MPYMHGSKKPGDYLVMSTGSWFGRAIRWATKSPVNHAALYVGGGLVVEAQPNGARLTWVGKYPDATWSHFPITDQERLRIVQVGQSLLDTPYNFLDIAAQAMVRILHWHAPKWALNRLSRSDRLQCAQLVDLAYHKAGVELFPDGRPSGMVSPGDLLDLIKETDG